MMVVRRQFERTPIVSETDITHYANMLMLYTVIFHECKNHNFLRKMIFFLFLLKA